MRTSYRRIRRDGELLTSKGQVVVVWKDDHNRANDEASFKPASSSSEPIGIAMGSGAVFVPQLEANEKEITGLLFEDMVLTFGVVLAVSVDLAESTRTDCGRDRRVGKSISEVCLFWLLYHCIFDRFSTGSLPLALFVFIAELMRIGRRGMSFWGCG